MRTLPALALGFLCSIFFLLEVTSGQVPVRVGVIVDGTGEVGKISWSCMKMALRDFYQAHDSYKTGLEFRFRDARRDIVLASTAALDLMENDEVHAIIGPELSIQAKFIIELGRKAQVPIISFAATSPSLDTKHNPYFVRSGHDDSSQVKAIAAIVQAFEWREVSLIYEDTDYGNGLIPDLTDAFQQLDIRVPDRSVISPSSKKLDNDMLKVLLHLRKLRAISAMEGVIGVRPHITTSRQLSDFKKRWKSPPAITLNSNETDNFNVFGLWAYDSVFALATGVEKAWTSLIPPKSIYLQRENKSADSTHSLSDIRKSKIGPKILQEIRNLRINRGLTGNFDLIDGQLQPSTFEVFNVVDGEEKVIGYWTQKHGLSKVPESEQSYSSSKYNLVPPIWPGGTREVPKGWSIPGNGEPALKIAVPVRVGFKEFFNVETDPHTHKSNFSGFAYDVFRAVLDKLPFAFPYEFVPFNNGSYDDMLMQIKQKVVDAVVGDTTIVSRRAEYVDFTLPYSESGVSMLVLVKTDDRNMWIFLKPLHWKLWLATGLAFFFIAIVVWLLEHGKNENFEGSWDQKIGLSLWFSFSTMVFAHREEVRNNWTRLVLVIWVFAVLILTQSYTASLASYLTVQQLRPKYNDVDEIRSKGYKVGYQNISFVAEDILIKELGFDRKSLIPYASIEQYHNALSKGEVAAIFDEIPYIRLFLAKYCNKFMMDGPTYKTDGFGFGFAPNSPWVQPFSRAILAVTQDKKKMDEIEIKNNLRQGLSCKVQSDDDDDHTNHNLTVNSFGGLFILTAAVSLLSLSGELIYSHRHAALTQMKLCYDKLMTQCFKAMENISRKLGHAKSSPSTVSSLDRRNSRIAPV